MPSSRERKVLYRRILYLDGELRRGRCPSLDDLAKAYGGVSTRTIARDFDYMRSMLDAPIVYDRERGGYRYEEPDFRLPALLVGEDELFSLAIIGETLSQYRNTPLYDPLARIMDKISSILPDRVSVDLSWLDSRFSFIRDPLPAIDPAVFHTIFEALRNCHSLAFIYRGLGKLESDERRIDPYHALSHRGSWYIVGHCHTRQAIRIFAFSRIVAPRVLEDAPFSLPADFAIGDWLDGSLGVYLNSEASYTARILCAPGMAVYIKERIWHEGQQILDNPDGSFVLELPCSQEIELVRWIIAQGENLKVLSPPRLVDAVVAMLDRTRARYAEKREE